MTSGPEFPHQKHPFLKPFQVAFFSEQLRGLPTAALPSAAQITDIFTANADRLRIFGEKERKAISKHGGSGEFSGLEIALLLSNQFLIPSSMHFDDITYLALSYTEDGLAPNEVIDTVLAITRAQRRVGVVEAHILLDGLVADPVVAASGHDFLNQVEEVNNRRANPDW
jgi:hypothetical protein